MFLFTRGVLLRLAFVTVVVPLIDWQLELGDGVELGELAGHVLEGLGPSRLDGGFPGEEIKGCSIPSLTYIASAFLYSHFIIHNASASTRLTHSCFLSYICLSLTKYKSVKHIILQRVSHFSIEEKHEHSSSKLQHSALCLRTFKKIKIKNSIRMRCCTFRKRYEEVLLSEFIQEVWEKNTLWNVVHLNLSVSPPVPGAFRHVRAGSEKSVPWKLDDGPQVGLTFRPFFSCGFSWSNF